MPDFHTRLEDLDDVRINPSQHPALHAVLAQERRALLKGSLGLALASFLGGGLTACASLSPGSAARLGFSSIDPELDPAFDGLSLPPGYTAQAFFSWGDPVLAGAPAWRGDAREDAAAQALQCGDNNDGMWFFPFPETPNSHGLLVINHEYINPALHPAGQLTMSKTADGRVLRPPAEVAKEKMAHGLSIIEIRCDEKGRWQRVFPSPYNRRLTAETPMRLSGPVAGTPWVKTVEDPQGRTVRGTLNNCAMGVTPWGTYLMCEENWHNYFVNRDPADYAQRESHSRYKLSAQGASKNYGWESVDARFDATPQAAQRHGGYVNEPHRFGWVVEVDPFDPHSEPVKRTALGRFCHEGATVTLCADGRVAVYSGDDTMGEYVYKFISSGRYRPGDREHNQQLLDSGTLYVGRFLPGGEGRWEALDASRAELSAQGYRSQADVLVNARRAADLLQATPLDRPEWVTVDEKTKAVYLSLTNHKGRGQEDRVDAANPRGPNPHGHILRRQEAGDDAAATRFRWEIFLLAGEPKNSKAPSHLRGSTDLAFSSPDGLWLDPRGRLWIATDSDTEKPEMAGMGHNQLLCADPLTRELRRFLVGPRGAEITGLTMTPDGRTLWLNVQHPEGSYPACDGKSRPRSTTVVIQKEDGGVIGS